MRLFVLGTVLAVLTGCSLNTNYFSDYTGTNLLSGYGFSNSGWASETKGLDNSSSSDLYMNWASALATGPGGGAAYKLETLNLIPDGNFYTVGTSGGATPSTIYWTTYSGDTVAAYSAATAWTGASNSSSASSTTSSLYYSGTASTSYLELNLATAIEATTGLSQPASHEYQFQADFINSGSEPFFVTAVNILDSTSVVSLAQLQTTTLTTNNTIYNFSSLAGVKSSLDLTYNTSFTSENLYFGYYDTSNNPAQKEEFYLSNVRLVPDDVSLYTKLALSSLTSTSKQLIPGTYTLSIYVKDDPRAGTTSNHFYAKGVTVQVTAATKTNLTKQVVVTSTRTSSWSSWTKLTFNLGTLDFVDSNSALSGNAALIIEISPTIMNSGTRDSGAIYVSDPTLTFSS